MFDVVGGNNSYNDFISKQSAHQGENTSALIDNQEAYNASGNWSLYEMEEGNFNLHTFYTHLIHLIYKVIDEQWLQYFTKNPLYF